MTRTLALVESPSQLLNVIEWARHTGRSTTTQIAVLLPADSITRYQLAMTAAVAGTAGLRVRTHELRRGPGQLLGQAGALALDVRRADRLVIGDPFSGLIQTMLPLARARSIVVVDDGTATLEFADCVARDRPLVRWRHDGPIPRRAVSAGRRFAPAAGRDRSVFTAMPGVAVAGVTTVANTYAWTRARSRPTVIAGGLDIVGASLVETGLVERAAYLGAVESISRRHPAARYIAHRREDPAKVDEIIARTGMAIVRPDVPVELALRLGPVAARVVTFPSTPAHTLPIVLADTGAAVLVHPIAPSWFTAAATPHARAFVHRVTDEAARHALQAT